VHAGHPVFERGDRRTRDSQPMFGELDGQIAEPVEDSEDFGADVGGKAERSLEEEILESVEILLGLVRVAGKVLRASEFVNEMANDLYDSYSHRIGLCDFPIEHAKKKVTKSKRNGRTSESRCESSKLICFKTARGAHSANCVRNFEKFLGLFVS
jgi:hypothetical protein